MRGYSSPATSCRSILLAIALVSVANVVAAETRQAAAERIAALIRARPYSPPVDEARRQKFIAERFKEASELAANGRADGKLFWLLVSDLQREGATDELRRLGVLEHMSAHSPP